MSGQVLRVSTARHNACLSNHIHIHTHIHIHFCVHQTPVYVRRRESKLQKMTTPILPPRRLASHCQQSELHRPLAGPRRAAVGETTIHMPISALALWRTSFCPAAEQKVTSGWCAGRWRGNRTSEESVDCRRDFLGFWMCFGVKGSKLDASCLFLFGGELSVMKGWGETDE